MKSSLLCCLTAGAIGIAGLGMASAQGVSSTGTDSASITLGGSVEIEPQLQLGLSADGLTFDLRSTARAASGQVCVTGSGPDIALNPALFGGDRLAPAGTDYRVTEFPAISVIGGAPLSAGPLAAAALDDVVCYRAFTLDIFSNEDAWQLSADRLDLQRGPAIEHLYLGAACQGDSATGLAAMPIDGHTTLVTGEVAGACQDLLVVVAVKVTSEGAGTSVAGIRYTLMSIDSGFGFSQAP